ncbi:Cupin 4 family protein [Chondromyces apiculatus DSM 436]|uniref:Cupin 4 family protein n=2 Tax=Chondromyces apiculatus TaxID=51 RepID=A0A017T6G3_9BACT|nr:Cupin 4 family protein [Chondromyces apiculatus DSM 436]
MLLADLLAPLSVARFASEHADRKPLHLPAGAAKRRRVQAFFDRERFARAIAQGHAATRGGSAEGFSLRAIFPPAHEGPVEIPIAPHQVDTLLGAGASVCVHDIHRADHALAALVSAAKHELSCVGQVGMSCYVSPAGHGLTTHFDAQAVLTLQVEGAKVWRYSEEPAVSVPRANAVLEASGKVEWTGEPLGDLPFPEIAPPTARMREVELTPGDVLYLPAGHWHETLAGSPSMGLVLYFVPLSFSAFLERWLWSCFEDNDAWIRGLPASTIAPGRVMQGVPGPVAAYLAARLDELRAMLSEVDAGDVQLARVWRRFVAQGSPAPAPVHAGPVRKGDLLRVVAPHLVSALQGKGEGEGAGIHLCVGDREIDLPASFAPLVREVLGGGAFRAGSIAGMAWKEAREALEVLLTEGVLERVDAAQAGAGTTGSG